MKVVILIAAAVFTLLGVVGGFAIRNLTSHFRAMRAVWKASVVERTVEIDGTLLTYAVGPNNGPPLLLIHGQGVDWRNYASVVPELVKRYQVFAIDCHGHGRSARAPEKYTAVGIGEDLRTFLADVVGRPAIVAGHSSGGQLAAWLGAHAPELVAGIVLEDPPMFTTLLPRARRTWNWNDLASTAYSFMQIDANDFVLWYVGHAKTWKLFGKLSVPLRRRLKERRLDEPSQPVRLWLLPSGLNEVLRGMQRFDPRFAVQFYTGAWNDGFDHEATLKALTQPTALIHANWSYDDDGILQGAMDDADAERARRLIRQCLFHRVDSQHDVHSGSSEEYIAIVDEVAAESTQTAP